MVQNNFLGLFGEMPTFDKLENPKNEFASELFSEDKVLLGKYFRENRSPVEFEEISPKFINTLIATEDVRFHEHSGIDLKGMLAIMPALLSGQKRGSSTLSQQLAKNLFDTRDEKYQGFLSKIPLLKTVIIKSKEWLTAIKIERSYTKEEIMTMYLNTVDFGSNAYGIKTASQTFFDKEPGELNYAESAVLVGVLKAPTLYSPILNPKNSMSRRNTVLEQLQKYDYLTREKCDSIKKAPIDLRFQVENHNKGSATYFRTIISNYLLDWCKTNNYDLYNDGLKIYTTINSKVQKYAEQAVYEHMKVIQARFFEHWKGKNPWADEQRKEIPGYIETAVKRSELYALYNEAYEGNQDSIDFYMNKKRRVSVFAWKGERDTLLSPVEEIKYYKKYLQAGFISMDPNNGQIKAWVGGINHKYFKYDHVRQGKRQPGSTFKPFVYATAMENGYTPCDEFPDVPTTFQFWDGAENKTWTPQNSEGVYTGKILTLRQAMARSVNSITANMIKIVGPEKVVVTAQKLGITSPLEAVPALCLGSSDVSIFELVNAYSTFVNNGTWTEPIFITRIEDKFGNVVQEFIPKTKEAMNEESAYLMVHMLKGGTQEKDGTALGLHRYKKIFEGNEIGGKTGTTSNYSDGWFVGVTPSLVSGAWVGGDDRCIHFTTYALGQGSRLALPIVGKFLEKVYADTTTGVRKGYFKRPANFNIELNCAKFKTGGKAESDDVMKPIEKPTFE
ncbi:MAG: transglycosylase domain-containing protein [Opitutaceae bacterium]|nr:transglycosylase domain-containing protein [Cytophagales bacterium]